MAHRRKDPWRKPLSQRDTSCLRHDEVILRAILDDGVLAAYSVVEEVQILLLFLTRHVLPRYDTYTCAMDIEQAQDYLAGRASRNQLRQRECAALTALDAMDESDRALQELTALFLNSHFLDGTEQNEDLGSFLYLLSQVEPHLCDEFYAFTQGLRKGR